MDQMEGVALYSPLSQPDISTESALQQTVQLLSKYGDKVES
jgi:hypothetical protein